jgi:hypothetical protein
VCLGIGLGVGGATTFHRASCRGVSRDCWVLGDEYHSLSGHRQGHNEVNERNRLVSPTDISRLLSSTIVSAEVAANGTWDSCNNSSRMRDSVE